MSDRPTMLIWADASQTSFVRDVVDRLDVSIIGAGSDRQGDAHELSAAVDCKVVDDLRNAIAQDAADVIWLAAPQALTSEIRSAIDAGSATVLTLSPPCGQAVDLIERPDRSLAARFVPLMRRSPGFRSAQELIDAAPPPSCVAVTSLARPHVSSLWALLFDAVDCVQTLLGDPESVFATLSSQSATIPDEVADLHGHLAVTMRFEDGRAASIVASDAASSWSRTALLPGFQGEDLVIGQWKAWTVLDAEGADEDLEHSMEAVVADEIIRHLRGPDTSTVMADHARMLALCETIRLSCLTGQVESPQRTLSMLRGE